MRVSYILNHVVICVCVVFVFGFVIRLLVPSRRECIQTIRDYIHCITMNKHCDLLLFWLKILSSDET